MKPPIWIALNSTSYFLYWNVHCRRTSRTDSILHCDFEAELCTDSRYFSPNHFLCYAVCIVLQPDLSAGLESDKLTVLNMVMFTGFNKARHQLGFVKSGVVVPLLTNIGRASPVLTVTVGGEREACHGRLSAVPTWRGRAVRLVRYSSVPQSRAVQCKPIQSGVESLKLRYIVRV